MAYDYKKSQRSASRTPRKRSPLAVAAPMARTDFPENYAQNPDVRTVLELVGAETPDPVLITGKAGTGKSTLVNYIRYFGNIPNTVVVAPTGVAALNVQGQTIHSFFRLPLQIIDDTALDNQRRNKIWSKVELVIIDEISMVRADILDGIDMILRKAQNPRVPFGGCKMVFVGDFFQLAPVAPGHEAEVLMDLGYAGPFAYHAKVFEQVNLKVFELTHVHRQTQKAFLDVLSDLRLGNNTRDAVQLLNEKCWGDHRSSASPLLLTATNRTAVRYNENGLKQLGGAPWVYGGKVKGKFNMNRVPVPQNLELKVGARVMAVKNDAKGRWVNGSIGTVTKLEDKAVSVRFDTSGKTERLEPVKWEDVRYSWDEVKNKTVSTVASTYAQIPLILSWAVTIHKAQGLTLEDVRIDFGNGAFTPGQAYVALSRAKTLEGLSLENALYVEDIKVEKSHFDFLMPDISDTESKSARDEDDDDKPSAQKVIKRINPDALTFKVTAWRAYAPENPAIPLFEAESLKSEILDYRFSEFAYPLSIEYEGRGVGLTQIKITAYHILFISGSNEWLLQAYNSEKNENQLFAIHRITRIIDPDKGSDTSKSIHAYLTALTRPEYLGALIITRK